MTVERRLYEQHRFDTDTVACLVEPQNLGAGANQTAWLGMANYDKVMFIVQGGAANDNAATLDVQVYQAIDNTGTSSKVITGKAITQVTSGAGFATLNDIWFIHVDVSELDVDASFAFISLIITVSALDTWYISVVCQRQTRVFEPVPTTNVTEIVD